MTSRPTRRIHYSAEPLGQVRSASQEDEGQLRGHMKPVGLWYSIGDDWEQWCRLEGFNLGRLAFRTALDVDTSRILHLDSETAIRDFSREYYSQIVPGSGLEGIDWPAVARDFAGIEIHPYQWGCRLKLIWYYGWDCASGVIWDARALRGFRRLRAKKRVAESQTCR